MDTGKMQIRPYDKADGRKVWLSRNEQQTLLDVYKDENPGRELAVRLGLHGLRSDETRRVSTGDFRQIDVDGDAPRWKLIIPSGKTGRRECPVSSETRGLATILGNAMGKGKREPLLDVSTRTLRNWTNDAAETVADESGNEDWNYVGTHDLRRTWATETFYGLAFEGVPIAEELTMGWGGWAMTDAGRETFRESYLGSEPDFLAAKAMDRLNL